MTLPLIAVAGRLRPPNPERGRRHPSVAVPAPEIRALHRAGAQEAVLLPVELDEDDARRRLERFDALMLIGGGDLEPARYGEDRRSEVYGVQAERDAFELALVRAAVDLDVPTLAICRGIQVLNVALGGTLVQDIESEVRRAVKHWDLEGWDQHSHEVNVDPSSRLAGMIGERVPVNSMHHQAVREPAGPLQAVGRAPDGVIEAVEAPDLRFCIGLQWHPECLGPDHPSFHVFEQFVRVAEGVRR